MAAAAVERWGVRILQQNGGGGQPGTTVARGAAAAKETELPMGPNAWLRSHPLMYLVMGAGIVALGLIRGQPIAIGAGVLVVLIGLVRIVI